MKNFNMYSHLANKTEFESDRKCNKFLKSESTIQKKSLLGASNSQWSNKKGSKQAELKGPSIVCPFIQKLNFRSGIQT